MVGKYVGFGMWRFSDPTDVGGFEYPFRGIKLLFEPLSH